MSLARERSRFNATPILLAALLLTPPAAGLAASVQVTAIVEEAAPLESTEDVTVSRFADFTDELGIKLGTELEIGDMISSVSGKTNVELTCGDETVLRFAGGFRVLIDDSAEGTDCAIDFLSGTLDVITDQPTEVDTGAVILGSEGTQYSVELTRQDGKADRKLLVFDGKVNVSAPGGVREKVESGVTWSLAAGRAAWGSVGVAELTKTSTRYAAFDASKANEPGMSGSAKAASVAQFSKLHYQVLSQPDDSQKRADLAKEQLKYSAAPQAVYHLQRANITTTEDFDRYAIDKKVLEGIGQSKTSLYTGNLQRIDQPVLKQQPDQIQTHQLQTHQLQTHRNLTLLPPDPFALIEKRRYKEAIELLTETAKTNADSRTWFGLAVAWFELEGMRSSKANGYAGQALKTNTRDRKLSSVEASRCQRIQEVFRKANG